MSWLVGRMRKRAGRGRPRQGGRRGLRSKFQGEPCARGRPQRGAARPVRLAGSLTPRVCQLAADWAPPSRVPTLGPNLPRTPAFWTLNVEPWKPLGCLAPLLFLSLGFQAEFEEAVWAKAASKDAS